MSKKEEVKLNKFATELANSNQNLKESRAAKVSERVRFAQEELIRSLEKQIFDIDSKIEKLTDLGPDNTYSLRVVSDDFNPEQWAKDLQSAKIERFMVERELKIANETMQEWFGGE